MKRQAIFVFAIITLLTVSIFIFSACPNSNTPSDETLGNGIKHYEILLNKNNFQDYIECNVSSTYASPNSLRVDFYEIKGVLTFAYYKDVTISYYVEFSNPDGLGGKTFYRGNYSIKLNAAGNYSFYTNNSELLKAINCSLYNNNTSKSLTILDVSGTVIFDI